LTFSDEKCLTGCARVNTYFWSTDCFLAETNRRFVPACFVPDWTCDDSTKLKKNSFELVISSLGKGHSLLKIPLLIEHVSLKNILHSTQWERILSIFLWLNKNIFQMGHLQSGKRTFPVKRPLLIEHVILDNILWNNSTKLERFVSIFLLKKKQNKKFWIGCLQSGKGTFPCW